MAEQFTANNTETKSKEMIQKYCSMIEMQGLETLGFGSIFKNSAHKKNFHWMGLHIYQNDSQKEF